MWFLLFIFEVTFYKYFFFSASKHNKKQRKHIESQYNKNNDPAMIQNNSLTNSDAHNQDDVDEFNLSLIIENIVSRPQSNPALSHFL